MKTIQDFFYRVENVKNGEAVKTLLSLEYHIRFCLGHGAVPPSTDLLQPVDPGLKLLFRDTSAEAPSLQPGTAPGESFHVGTTLTDST